MDHRSFFGSDLFFKIALYGGEALILFVLVLYKKYVTLKIKEIFAAIFMMSGISLFTYLTVRMNSIRFKFAFFGCTIIIAYIFFWIFIKDGGENKKHLN